ncbi:MAG TPA: SMC-Scp complex subunit ScpB [Phycisphaerae bacterium]|nr:SMC-Scp complex subunit ScpB [Phycisphaerae bacterium]
MDDNSIVATDRAPVSCAEDAWHDVSENSCPPLEFQEPMLTDGVGAAASSDYAAALDGPMAGPALCCAPPETPAEETETAQVIEALLFASDTPLSAARLAELARAGTPTEIRIHIEQLNQKYAEAGLSFRIEAIARGYQMLTLPAFRPWLDKLDKQRSQTRLSPAALETLSIVAYKQPVIRAEIEAIRGVACGDLLIRLREMGLVRVVGRAEVVGRPMLYGTTRRFLDVFGLASLDDLPPLEAHTLKAQSKPVEEVEPIPPPAAELEPIEPHAVAGAQIG